MSLKPLLIAFAIALASAGSLAAAESIDPKRAANTITLDETGVKNLRLETVDVEETDFEQTLFSLGRIEAIPAHRSGVSSRIPGRITQLKFSLGDEVAAGAEVATLESRQPGDPPPSIPLRASAGGLVTKADVAQGQPLEPEQTLMEITNLSEVWAIARVPEHQAGRLQPGTTARIRVTSLPEEQFDGQLLRFATEADRSSGTLDAIFKLPNPNLTLRPGMRAEFSIVLGKREGVMSVPRAALQGEPAARFVYVKDFELPNSFIKSPVEVGETNDRSVEIISGLLPGDSVVTRGAYSLSFAGASSVSLKEALDAAHGHEHAADGSELTPEKKAEIEASKVAAGGAHAHDEPGVSPMWMYASGVLFLLLVVSSLTRKRAQADEEDASAPVKKEAA